MTTDTEALICDCPAKNMPFGRCCKVTPNTALSRPGAAMD